MSRLIPDPIDETQAIDTTTGRMAPQVFFLRDADPDVPPTVTQLADAQFVGWAHDPKETP